MGLGDDTGDDIIIFMRVQHMFEILDSAEQRFGKAAVDIFDRVFRRHHNISARTKGHQLGHRHRSGGKGVVCVSAANCLGQTSPVFLPH